MYVCESLRMYVKYSIDELRGHWKTFNMDIIHGSVIVFCFKPESTKNQVSDLTVW